MSEVNAAGLAAASALLAAAAALLACGEGTPAPGEPGSVELTQAPDWSPASPDVDPFDAYADERVRCSAAAIRPEGTWIEVTTTTCNYSTLVAPFARAARAGSQIRGEIAWATLAAVDPGIATLAFALGQQVLWSREVPIPGEANLVSVEFVLPRAVPAGSSLFFHVRNHGYNSWQLSPLELLGS